MKCFELQLNTTEPHFIAMILWHTTRGRTRSNGTRTTLENHWFNRSVHVAHAVDNIIESSTPATAWRWRIFSHGQRNWTERDREKKNEKPCCLHICMCSCDILQKYCIHASWGRVNVTPLSDLVYHVTPQWQFCSPTLGNVFIYLFSLRPHQHNAPTAHFASGRHLTDLA